MEIIFALILSFSFFFLFEFLDRRAFFKAREKSEKLTAVVVEYRSEKIKSLRNNYSRIDYPYVTIKEYGTKELYCLRHASSSKRYYETGTEVDVFWYEDVLVSWHSRRTFSFTFGKNK